jgi:hypothetical protein
VNLYVDTVLFMGWELGYHLNWGLGFHLNWESGFHLNWGLGFLCYQNLKF